MSLRTARANFQKAFLDEDKTLTEKFLQELRSYMTKRIEEPRYRELLKCMDENSPLASFFCRNDICDELVLEMLRREIPFILVSNRKGEYGFVIRSSDRALANEAIKAVLKKMGTYCDIVTGEELVSIVQKIKSNDKGMLAVNGLTHMEMKMLEKLCRKGGFLDHIAEDRMSDGSYRFMVYGRQAVAEQNFAAVIFELAMMLEGPNSEIFKNRIKNELKVENLRRNDFDRKLGMSEPIYITGNGNQYIKMEQNGFEYGHAVRTRKGIIYEPMFTSTTNLPGYREYETSYLNRIPNPACTTSLEQLNEHFEIRYKRDSLDFGMSPLEKRNYFGEKILIASIMEVVFRNSANDDIMNVSERWMEKTAHMTFEAGRVLTGLITGELPSGYDETDIQEIKPVIVQYGIDLSNYTGVAAIMKGISITNERGSLEIGGDLHERISDLHENVISGRGTETIDEEIEEYSQSPI